MLQFSCRFAFLSTFRLSNRTPKITRILMLYQAQTHQRWWGAIFWKHTPKLIIFHTHNLQTFKHNPLINESLLMQFYLFNIRPKLHHRKWRNLCVTLFRTFSTSPAACWCQAVWRTTYKIRVIFCVQFERWKVDKKSKPTQKLKHTNSILEYFEYFCQI